MSMATTREFWAYREPALISHGLKRLSNIGAICGGAMVSLWLAVFPCRARKF